MERTSHSRGQHAENACCKYLQQQGLKLLAKNYRSYKGEIDIIMQDKDTLVFIEVRFRKNDHYGGGLESITPKKKKRILATAEQYLQRETILENGRIDVVAMSQKPQDATSLHRSSDLSKEEYVFEWVKDAF
jgi:putative endonuclease